MRHPILRPDLLSAPPGPGGATSLSPASSAVQPSLLARLNEQAVVRTIRAQGPLSRVELARQLGFTAPTASKAVDSLLQLGWLVEESASGDPARGRPAKRLLLPPRRRAQILGVVIDSREYRVVAADLDGTLQEEGAVALPTPPDYETLIAQITTAAQSLVDRPGVTTFGVGITLPGLVDNREQQGVLSPNLPITNGRSPGKDLRERLNLPCAQIQEEHALCLAERAYGNARGLDDFAMLDISTGVGLGIVSSGRLLGGHRGLAGELGHITVVPESGKLCGCGNYGCLETEASETALALALSERLGRADRLDAAAVQALIRSGALQAEAEVDRYLRFLAIGSAAVINLFNVSTLFVHGEMFAVFPGLFERLVAETERRALKPSFEDCRMVRARGSKRLGAVAGILEYLIESIVPPVYGGSR